MKKIIFNINDQHNKKSTIIFQKNIKEKFFNICSKYFIFNKIYIICDSNVYESYGKYIFIKLKNHNIKTFIIILNVNENMKNIDTVNFIYQKLSQFYFNKNDLIISIGGGITSDIANFVSATYVRGINICNIPTTLLAQVDASIGGKCGVNSSFCKNNIGCYHLIPLIIIDNNIINELPSKILYNGISEVIKYGLIADMNIIKKLLKDKIDFNNIIYNCINIKKAIIEKDFFDKNIRLSLNYGHTIGHAIEMINQYNDFSHGDAISLGIYYSIKLGILINENNLNDLMILINLFKKFSFKYEYKFDYKELYSHIIYDKKIINNHINFIFAKNGNFSIKKIELNFLKKLLKQILE